MTGEEYLRRVQLEAAKCPKVVVAPHPQVKLNEDENSFHDVFDKEFVKSKNPLPLLLQQQLISDFSSTRMRLEQMRDSLSDEDKKRSRSHHPNLSNVVYYKKWCLGREVETDSSDEELIDSRNVRRTSRNKGPKQPPVQQKSLPLKFLLSLDQQEILSLIEMQVKWINDYGFDCETNGSWVHSLLSALEKPLSSNAYSILRDISRCISQCRKDEEDQEEEEDNEEVQSNLESMSLIICIIGRYFDQKDLLD